MIYVKRMLVPMFVALVWLLGSLSTALPRWSVLPIGGVIGVLGALVGIRAFPNERTQQVEWPESLHTAVQDTLKTFCELGFIESWNREGERYVVAYNDNGHVYEMEVRNVFAFIAGAHAVCSRLQKEEK